VQRELARDVDHEAERVPRDITQQQPEGLDAAVIGGQTVAQRTAEDSVVSVPQTALVAREFTALRLATGKPSAPP